MLKRKNKTSKFGVFLMIGLMVAVALCAGVIIQILLQLPDVETLNSYLPSESTIFYAADGSILARIHREENRQVVPLSRISPYFYQAVIATEDPNFYHHHGLDFKGIIRAGFKNLVYGRVMEGGSTISQQLARNIFLTRKKTFARKLAEAILALQLERRYTKDEILELYLNQVYLGHNSYGIESAANLYFGKHASDLSLAEASMIAGVIRGPEVYSPFRNFQEAKNRQVFVLNRMLEHNFITREEGERAAQEALVFSPKNLKQLGEIGPYFISYVLQDLIDKYGEEMVYHGGLKVYTTIDPVMQAAADELISRFSSEEGSKYNFSQLALVSIDPRTGGIKAMVGGVDFYASKFNRAVQSKRQPGSSFKPFVYATAIEQGMAPGTVLQDSATTFRVWPNRWNPFGTWTPKNFDGKFHGAVTMRYALEKSFNLPAIKVMEKVGVQNVINTAQKMGITSHLEPGLSLTLGASEVSLLEMTSAFGVFANSGIRVEPTAVTKIENRDGSPIFEQNLHETRVLDQNVAAVMVDMMKGVLTRGTGVRGYIDRPAAAKTGTTQDFKDAWFIGFVPQLVTGVWAGNDNNSPMHGVAEVAVCPRIWKAYNEIALAKIPPTDFPRPEGLVNVKICLDSDKLAGPYCPADRVQWVSLWQKDVPTSSCDIHTSDSIIENNSGSEENTGDPAQQ